jgi:hypothetical protein
LGGPWGTPFLRVLSISVTLSVLISPFSWQANKLLSHQKFGRPTIRGEVCETLRHMRLYIRGHCEWRKNEAQLFAYMALEAGSFFRKNTFFRHQDSPYA